jgi:trans-aconitate methyltransferase
MAMAEKFPDARIIGLDIDCSMLEKAKLRIKSSTLIGSPSFKKKEEQQVTCLQKSYADIENVLQ